MKKEHLTEEQMIFQDAVRTFFEREITPNNEQWEKDGQVSREAWLKAGANNFFGIDVPEKYADEFWKNHIPTAISRRIWQQSGRLGVLE